jgi:hypothetical protein
MPFELFHNSFDDVRKSQLVESKPGREGPVSVMDFGENPWDDFNYRPIVDIVAEKKSVYRWF